MNKKNKFRVWDVQNNMFQTTGSYLFELLSLEYNGFIKSNHPNYIFQQFTGLLDKNGKEIYEGDIVKSDDLKFIVRWVYELAAFSPFCQFDHYSPSELEIVGNIFENAQMIK